MATLEQLAEGIRRAHAAGNAEHVKILGAEYRRLQAMEAQGAQGETVPAAAPEPQTDLADQISAGFTSGVRAIPVAGPWIMDRLEEGKAALHGVPVETIRAEDRGWEEANPIASGVGTVAGTVLPFMGAGAIPGVGRALGMTGNLATRATMGGLSGTAISVADTLARGGTANDAVEAAKWGGGIGAGIPVVGAGLKAGGQLLGRALEPTVGAIRDAGAEALRRTGKAVLRDRNAGATMLPADEAVARLNGLPIINADRGGETVRALARSVANQSPEARQVIEKTASDRFAGQADRAVQFVRRIAGGAVDDLGYQRSIKEAAAYVNRPAYDAAFNSPHAQAVWNQPIADLMQSDTFRAAIKAAERRGTDRAAVGGFKAVRNPFEFLPDGGVTLRTNADGSRALPSLQFWDQVKRNLDGMIGTAQRQGDNTLVADLTAMKAKLTGALDSAVPAYARARAGAASFFGADDALEAGKMFANHTRQVPEATKAFNAMKPAEQAAFRTGYASEIIDKIKDARFRANVIDQAFGSPAKREMVELVFGKAKARELEAYVRVEELADRLRGAMGNSTTARQLMEMGIGAGSGALLTGGDWKGALTGAGVARGLRYVGRRVDDKVMREIGTILTSGDETLMQKAIFNASKSPMWMDGLEAWGKALSAPSRGAIVAPERRREPVEILVQGGR